MRTCLLTSHHKCEHICWHNTTEGGGSQIFRNDSNYVQDNERWWGSYGNRKQITKEIYGINFYLNEARKTSRRSIKNTCFCLLFGRSDATTFPLSQFFASFTLCMEFSFWRQKHFPLFTVVAKFEKYLTRIIWGLDLKQTSYILPTMQ